MKFWKQPPPKTVQQMIADQLYTAEVDRIEAKLKAEHWKSMANMLDDRVNRLKTSLLLEQK
jgi:hypothetical protein